MGGLEPLPLTGAKKPLHLPNETLKFYRLGVVIIAPSLDGLFPVAGHGVRRQSDDRHAARRII
jgi:hypothetical protein